MTDDTLNRLSETLMGSSILRAATVPDAQEIEIASQEIGVRFSQDYREFLLNFGGAMVGPFPIFGLRPVEVMGDHDWSVIEVTKRCRADNVPGSAAWLIVSSDHSGNPVGMDSAGAVWIYDHDFGGAALLAETFEQYIRVQCLGLPADGLQ